MNPLAMFQNMSLGPSGGYKELLTEEQLKAARQHGMLGAGAAMMAGGGWSQQPRTLGQQLGAGLMGGMQMQGQAMNQMATLGLAQQTRQQQERALEQRERAANQPKWKERKTEDGKIVGGWEYPSVDGGPPRFVPVETAPRFAPPAPRAPTTRRIRQGDYDVDQEYDMESQTWRNVGSGPRLGRTPEDTAALRRNDQRYEETRGTVGQVEGALSLLRRLGPGVSGIRGMVGEAASGVAGQVSPTLGDSVARGITGIGDQELSEIRTEAMTLAARLVPVTTGENSGRISDKEREISKDIAAGNLNFLKNPQQARGSLIVLTQIALKDEYMNRALNGEPVANDLNTPEGVDRMQEALVGRGMTDEEAIRVIKEVRNSTLPLMGQGNLRPLF